MQSANDSIVRAVMHDPSVLTRFWLSVDRSESEDACWEWRAKPGHGGYPVFRVRYRSVSVARVAWFAATGEFPLGGRMRHTCGNLSCVRAEHLVWELGILSDRVLQTRSCGYTSAAAMGSAVRPSVADAPYRRAS